MSARMWDYLYTPPPIDSGSTHYDDLSPSCFADGVRTQRRIYNVMHAPPRSFLEAGGLAAGATPSAQNMLDDDDGTPLMQRYACTHATTHIIWTVSVDTVMFLSVR